MRRPRPEVVGYVLSAALLSGCSPARPPARPPAPPGPRSSGPEGEIVDRHGHTLGRLPPRAGDAACAPDLYAYLYRQRLRAGRVATRIDGGMQALAQLAVQRGLERLARTSLPPDAGPVRAGQARVATIVAVGPHALALDLGGARATLELPPPVACPGHATAPLPSPAARFRPGERLLVQVRSAGSAGIRVALQRQAALLALEPRSRDVLALVGGYGQRPGDRDRATEGARPAGAVFQPLIYAAALRSGRFGPRSEVETGPFAAGAGGGRQTLGEALAQSATPAAVRLLAEVGVGAVLDLAARLGIPGDQLPHDLSLPLRARLTPWQLAGAYATLADTRAGCHVPPRLLEEREAEPEGPAEIPPHVAYQVSRLLHRVVDAGTGTPAQALGAPDLAGKTGTGEGGRDAWFVGYHGELLAVVWVGAEGDRAAPVSSAEAALPLWLDFMLGAQALLPRGPAPLYRPPGVPDETGG